jgi:hypothetical protein
MSQTGTDLPTMALLSDGSPVVAWGDGSQIITSPPSGTPSQIYTVVWIPDGSCGTWQALGGPVDGNSPALLVPPGGNDLFRAWVSNDQISTLTVDRWNGTAFETLGGASFPARFLSITAPVMAADASGNPTVAWLDSFGAISTPPYVQVSRWNGSSWQTLTLGSNQAGVLGMQAINIARGLSLAVTPTGAPVVAFTSQQSYAPVVAQFVSGTTWTMLGALPPPPAGGGPTSQPVLRSNAAGDLFVGWIMWDANDLYHLTVARWDGTTWRPLGDQVNAVGQAEYFDMAIDSSGAPVVVDVEFVASEMVDHLYAYRWDGAVWQAAAPGLASGASPEARAADSAIALDGSGRLVVSWRNLTFPNPSAAVAVARYQP